jgi:hypothetical protein
MIKRLESPVSNEPMVPRVPAWALPRRAPDSDVEAAYMAGGALNALDNLAHLDAAWLGAWRHRQALKAAIASMKLAGRREDEGALRDAWYLRPAGSDAGPAGNVLAAWRRLCERSTLPDETSLRSLAELLGTAWTDALADLPELAHELLQSSAPAPIVAARLANAVVVRQPKAELLAWWLADFALAARMRWPLPVPLLATQINAPLLRAGNDGSRRKPGDPGFERALCVALSLGAADACKLATALSSQAQVLRMIEPKLRSKAASEVVERLLADDAVSGSLTTEKLSRWASRRLFERLQQLGAVRELSGRDSFKLFGL